MLYGCGTGGDGAPYRSAGEFGTVAAVELGLGYRRGIWPLRYDWPEGDELVALVRGIV